MASRNIKGITIEIDGQTKGLQDSLKSVNTTLKDTQTALRDVNKLLKLDPGNVDLLKQKQGLLKDAIKATNDKLAQEKTAYEQLKAADPTDENKRKMAELERQIIDDENALKSLKEESKSFGSVFKQQVAAASEKMKELGDKLTNIGSQMTTKVTAPIVAGFTASAAAASDYEENLNKIDVAFGDSSGAVKDWANNALQQFGLSKVAATDAVSAFGALGKGIGLASDDAADMSINLAGLSADLASYFNTSTDESAKALEGIFTGETEALKKFGVVMSETNLKQFAKDQGLVYSELSQTEKTMLRYQFVLEKTGDAQGDYARTSDGTANSTKTFKAAISDVGVAIGTQVLPIITPFIQKLTEIITSFSNLNPETQKTIVIIGMVVAAIGPLVTILGGVASGLSFLISPMGLVVAAIAALIAIGVALYKNWDKICEWAGKVKDQVVQAWTNLKQNVTDKVNAVKEGVSNAWNTMTSTVSEKMGAMKEGVSNAWNTMTSTVSEKMGAMKDMISGKWDAIKAKYQEAGGGIKGIVSGMIEGVKQYWTLGFDTINTLTGGKLNAVKDKIQTILTSAKDIVKGIIDKIKGLFNFSWSLPKLKLPHFHVTGGKVPWGIGGVGYPPSMSIDWYRKAYDKPIMFTKPTVLQTPQGAKGFGDGAGAEIVLGLNKLREMVGGSRTVTNNIVVNAAPGMDVNELADAVADRIAFTTQQSQAVFA